MLQRVCRVVQSVCMSKKHDPFKQVRLTPTNYKKLRAIKPHMPYSPSLVGMVNQILKEWIERSEHIFIKP